MKTCWLASLLAVIPTYVTAQTPSRSDPTIPIAYFDMSFAKPVTAAKIKTFHSHMDDEELDSLLGFDVDLNRDGKRDFIRVSGQRLCGTGGCQYQIFDGKSKKQVASLFGGSVWIHPIKTHGWPLLSIYSHSSAGSGTYYMMMFDGKKYTITSSIFLYEKSLDDLFEKYKDLPKIK